MTDLLAAEQDQSVIVFGPQARTVACLSVPAILEWQGPVLVCTTSDELIQLTSDHRAEQNGRVWLVDPSTTVKQRIHGPGSRHAMKRYGWSPVQAIEDAPAAQRWPVARRTAQLLVQGVRTGSAAGPDATWSLAEQALAPMLLAATAEQQPIGQVADWLDRRATQEVAEILDRIGINEAVAAWDAATVLDGGLSAGAAQVLHVVLDPYRDPAVAGQTRREPALQVQPHQLLDGRANTLYVYVAPSSGERHRPLLAALVGQVIDAAMAQAAASGARRLAQPLLVVVDGTLQCTPPAVLDYLAASGGDIGIQLLCLFPGLNLLEQAFGPDQAMQTVSRHRARMALADVHDDATLNYLGSLSQFADGSVDWLRTVQDDEAVLVYGSAAPVRLTLRSWQSDERLRQRVRPATMAATGPGAVRGSGPAREPLRTRLWNRIRDRQRPEDDPLFGGYPEPPGAGGSNRGSWGQGPLRG